MNKILSYILPFLFISCSVSKQLTTTSSLQHKDSIIYIEKVKVDTVIIPKSEAIATLPLQQLKDTIIINHSKGQATARLVIKQGKINCEAYCDSILKLNINREKETQKYTAITDKSTSFTKISKQCNRFLWFSVGFITAILILALSIIGILIFKPR